MLYICPICWALVSWDEYDYGRDVLGIHLATAHHAHLDEDGQVVHDPPDPAPVPVPHLRTRQVATVALLLGASADVDVTWDTPMPSAQYEVAVALAPALAGRVTHTVTERTAAGIRVRLTAATTGVAVSASTLHATALAITMEVPDGD